MAMSPGFLLIAGAGGIVLYSGITGKSVTGAMRALIGGDTPGSAAKDPNLAIQSYAYQGAGSSNPAGGAGADATAVDALANGTSIYKFLRGNGYTEMQAAGAIASMWGESTWNPESVGSCGCGIMGWNIPPGKPGACASGAASNNITTYGGECKAAGVGNGSTSSDLNSQLAAILRYVQINGDESAVAMMAGAGSVSSSALMWGEHVERFGISDVHPTGVSTAQQIAKTVDGVSLP